MLRHRCQIGPAMSDWSSPDIRWAATFHRDQDADLSKETKRSIKYRSRSGACVMVCTSTLCSKHKSAIRMTISNRPSPRFTTSLSPPAAFCTPAAARAMRGMMSRLAHSTGSQAPTVRKYADSKARNCTSYWSLSSTKSMVTTIVSRHTKGFRSSRGARAMPCSTSMSATLDDAAVSSDARRPMNTNMLRSGSTSSGFRLV
mmetsp:Transcript_103098/g.266582  ORF Transcript_103098/g.266582 Transcript_103098/m.266582 type:complete len:201 (+) Transcript_103098:107-709(+)